MKFAILTLGNPEREGTRQLIRDAMDGYEEVFPGCVDGKDKEALRAHKNFYGISIKAEGGGSNRWRPGELGLWYSNINAWDLAVRLDESLMVFEDDAVPTEEFRKVLDSTPVPDDADFATYYIPYRNSFQISPFSFAPIAQEHGNICVLYTPTGARAIMEELHSAGISWPVDIWIYKKALFEGKLKGYGPKTTSRVIVDHDWTVPTNIHEDDRIDASAI